MSLVVYSLEAARVITRNSFKIASEEMHLFGCISSHRQRVQLFQVLCPDSLETGDADDTGQILTKYMSFLVSSHRESVRLQRKRDITQILCCLPRGDFFRLLLVQKKKWTAEE
jgi:hypothetical protein